MNVQSKVMPTLTHRQLRYFVEIVEAGSFTLAADRLFIAQSALSRQVREMEEDMQVTLLERDTRSLGMTAAGRSLYADARRILAALKEAVASAVHAQRGTEGSLLLLHSSSVPLTPRILAFLREHVDQKPGVLIEVSQCSSEQQAMDIHEGHADVGLARAPILRRHDDLHYIPLYEELLMAAVPEEHPLSGRAAVSIGELRQELFVATPHIEWGGLSHQVFELCRAQGFQPEKAAVRSRKLSQLALVQGGFGVAIVPQSMRQLAPEGVCFVPLKGGCCTAGVMAIWRRDAVPLVKRFAESLTAFLSGNEDVLSGC